MSDQTTPRYVDAADLADAFGVDIKTIRVWEGSGKLPPALRGPDGSGHRKWLVDVAADALRRGGYPVPEAWT